MSRYFSCLNLSLPRGLSAVLIALVAFSATPASAATEPVAPATTTYTTKAGDTVERVLKNAMADSPLNPQVLRKALADANPNVVNGKAGQKFKPGTALQLPEHSALVRNTLETFSAPGNDGYSRSGTSASDPASRRHWIRYP